MNFLCLVPVNSVCNNHKIEKHFQNVMLVGMASDVSKNYTYKTSVWIAQDTTASRVPRLNMHTNQILAHTFSHGTLDSVVFGAIHTLVTVCEGLLISLAIPTNITF